MLLSVLGVNESLLAKRAGPGVESRGVPVLGLGDCDMPFEDYVGPMLAFLSPRRSVSTALRLFLERVLYSLDNASLLQLLPPCWQIQL